MQLVKKPGDHKAPIWLIPSNNWLIGLRTPQYLSSISYKSQSQCELAFSSPTFPICLSMFSPSSAQNQPFRSHRISFGTAHAIKASIKASGTARQWPSPPRSKEQQRPKPSAKSCQELACSEYLGPRGTTVGHS